MSSVHLLPSAVLMAVAAQGPCIGLWFATANPFQ
jgi:hypothetical protein